MYGSSVDAVGFIGSDGDGIWGYAEGVEFFFEVTIAEGGCLEGAGADAGERGEGCRPSACWGGGFIVVAFDRHVSVSRRMMTASSADLGKERRSGKFDVEMSTIRRSGVCLLNPILIIYGDNFKVHLIYIFLHL